MSNELLYQIALSVIPNIGPVQARILINHFGDAVSVFRAKPHQLKNIAGIGDIRACNVKSFDQFDIAEKEIEFINRYNIRPLFITDKEYPQRLLHCYDAPVLLYYKGVANLNTSKVVAIVGTRNHSEYGKQLAEMLIKELSQQNILIASGLAHGIDSIAHRSALRNNLSTVGVLAHGLDQVYPVQHTSLAREMLKENGGLLTEFRSGTNPDKHNFPTRNRIVAGMSDATIVVETGIKGGSMITAELANSYNKDVFAFPGKITDSKSAGCNYLIKTNKAVLLGGARDLLELMGWEENKNKAAPRIQKQLFIELTTDEKVVIEILRQSGSVHIDELNLKSGLSSSTVAATILNLELNNLVQAAPGKLYKLI